MQHLLCKVLRLSHIPHVRHYLAANAISVAHLFLSKQLYQRR